MERKKMEIHDLARLTRITDELAQMHLDYIKQGFTTVEIAETLGRSYFHSFNAKLDEEGVKCLRCELSANSQMCGSGTTFEATGRVCIRMASGLLRAVSKKINEKS